MNKWIRLCLLLAALCLLAGFALAEGEFPALNEAGFLDEGEFVYENPDEGVWRYCSSHLKVELLRHQETEPVKRIWYEAEVWTDGTVVWGMPTAQEGKHISVTRWPYLVAQTNGCVLAVNNDYAHGRYANKNNAVGIIIREGKIFWSKTKKAGYKGFPNLDNLALFPDGDMQVYDNAEYTADEFLEMGATDVLSFGPVLIRDGVLNEEDVYSFGKENAPRTAVGMVEKGHYWAMMLEGRHKESKGGPISFLAEKLLEKGCVTAFNLDGGETACILFMGKQICTVGGSSTGRARRTSELLAIGTSALVEGYEGTVE